MIIRLLTFSRLLRMFRIKVDLENQACALQVIDTSFKFDSGSNLTSLGLFAHWDATKSLSAPDLHTISLLRNCGFRVVVVTTALNSTQEHLDFWESYSGEIDGLISRKNLGFDFGSWSDGIRILDLNKITFDELILMNNSLFPVTENLSPVLEKFRNNIDVGGLIWSNEFRRHIQSFFLYFSSRAISTSEFHYFWNKLIALKKPSAGKRHVITRFELTWADYFSKNRNLKVGTVFEAPFKSVRNPMTFYWRDLISLDFPFVKKSLFRENHENVDTSNWLDFVGDRLSSKASMDILEDIQSSSFVRKATENR